MLVHSKILVGSRHLLLKTATSLLYDGAEGFEAVGTVGWIGLLHLIPVPPLSRTSFSKGEISHFFQRGNWEKWKKNALSRGVKKQKCTSRGGSSPFQRGHYTDFFAFQRGKIPKSRGPRQGGVWFFNVIAHCLVINVTMSRGGNDRGYLPWTIACERYLAS